MHYIAAGWKRLNEWAHHSGLLSAAGGFAGILLVYWIGGLCSDHGAFPVIIAAPIGASAVLVFGYHHSPLAQPWSVAASHLCAALVGVTAARYVPGTVLPAAVAVGGALFAMHWLRCIHPPAGATALFAVIGGPAIHALGYGYVLAPVMLNVALLLGAAWLYNNIWLVRRYPFRPLPAPANHAPPALSCADLMRPARVTLTCETTIGIAWSRLMHERVAGAPVIDADRRVVGLLIMTDILDAANRHDSPDLAVHAVRERMRTDIVPVQCSAPLTAASALLAEKGAALLPVADASGELAGIITRRDLLAAVAEAGIARQELLRA